MSLFPFVCCQFCKLQEQETLKDLYNQDDDHQELANYYVTASYREKVRTANRHAQQRLDSSIITVITCLLFTCPSAEVGGPAVSSAERCR